MSLLNELGGVLVSNPIEILYARGLAMACDTNGQMRTDQLHGLFARDTRVLSTYQLRINGRPWRLLGRSRPDPSTGRWEFQNPPLKDPATITDEGSLLLSLERKVSDSLQDRLRVFSFSDRPARFRLSLQLDGDFSDIFEVKERTIPPRLSVRRVFHSKGVSLHYETRNFYRGLEINLNASGSAVMNMGAAFVFDLAIDPTGSWECELEAIPRYARVHRPLSSTKANAPAQPRSVPRRAVRIETLRLLQLPFERGHEDLESLAVPQEGQDPYVAAGAPWFLTLFGRDALVTALMAGIQGPWLAQGALAALQSWQARQRDDWRDAEPGKFPHELRLGELAQTGRIPHSPYYGAHDVPALYCMTLWNAWRWTGKTSLLHEHLESARAALEWCKNWGDSDGDGFLEYQTRSARGYRNQGWKDAHDAIVHADGSQANPPLATVELQGYLFAAYLAMAEILKNLGHDSEAQLMVKEAELLRARVEGRFWMEEERFYALALDSAKNPVKAIASNPTHLLWCGLPLVDRARDVAERILKPELFSGWGMRTLSSENPAYNPLSYQRGSVWPHDTALAIAGLMRYGFYDYADPLLRSLLEAACRFEQGRLPELFSGLGPEYGPPVPYEKANIPQAWAAAAPALAVQLLLGILPDAPNGKCFLTPYLPQWLPKLEVHDLLIGDSRIRIRLARNNDRTEIERLDSEGIQVEIGAPEAPLWGNPPQLGAGASSSLSRRLA